MPSLNPALEDVRFCPRCAAEAQITFPHEGRVLARAAERTVLVVFHARALGAGHETGEAAEVRAFAPAELPWDELAFWSTERALRDALGQ